MLYIRFLWSCSYACLWAAYHKKSFNIVFGGFLDLVDDLIAEGPLLDVVVYILLRSVASCFGTVSILESLSGTSM
jgi:hypothetical protein